MSVYSVTQEPNVLVGTGQPIIFTAFDTETANIYPNGDADVWKFRYICDIYIDTGSGSTKVARLKQLPNAENVGIFDISRIVNSFLYPTLVNQGITTNSIHTLPLGDLGDPFSLNDSSLETVICKFGEEFATTATGSPTVHADRHTETARYAFQASVPYNAGVNYAFGDFISNGTTKRFLTYMPDYSIQGQTIKVSNNEWRTMTFLNDSATCQINRLYVQIFNSSGVKLNSNDYFENTNANGGANPSSEVDTDPERLLFVGVGVKNLNIQTLVSDMQISGHATAAYYEVFGTNASDTQKTTKYRFELDGNDCKYPMKQFTWLNRLGGWDYFSFKKKDVKTLNIKRTKMKEPLGTFNAATYAENSFDRGSKTLKADAVYSESANTDYLSEIQAEWLEGLFTSNNVYLIDTEQDIYTQATGTTISADAPNVIPVVITSATFVKKTSVNDQCKIQYTMEYEYSKEQRVGI